MTHKTLEYLNSWGNGTIYNRVWNRKGVILLDALQQTQEQLKKVLLLQQAKQREISSIRSKKYVIRGRCQFAITDAEKKSMIAKVEKECNKHCSKIYDELNQVRIQEGLPELTNPYNN